MPDGRHPPQLRLTSPHNGNGNGNGDDRREDDEAEAIRVDFEAIRDLPAFERVVQTTNHSLEAFVQVGQILRTNNEILKATRQQSKNVEEATEHVREMRAMLRRWEVAGKIQKKKVETQTKLSRNFDSIIDMSEIDPSDATGVRTLKGTVREMADAVVSKEGTIATLEKRVKVFTGFGVAFLVLLAILAALWKIFGYGVTHAKEPFPAKPNIELPNE